MVVNDLHGNNVMIGIVDQDGRRFALWEVISGWWRSFQAHEVPA